MTRAKAIKILSKYQKSLECITETRKEKFIEHTCLKGITRMIGEISRVHQRSKDTSSGFFNEYRG